MGEAGLPFPQVQEGIEPGDVERVGPDEHAVLGNQAQARAERVQAGSRFAGAAVTEQQHRAVTRSDTGGMQRHQSMAASEQREHREFD